MSRRFVVVVDGGVSGQGTSCYGPWRSYDRALAFHDGLIARSGHYNDDPSLPEYEVSLLELEPWPGYKKAVGV